MGFCQDKLSAERRIKVLLQDHSTLAAANSELERKMETVGTSSDFRSSKKKRNLCNLMLLSIRLVSSLMS